MPSTLQSLTKPFMLAMLTGVFATSIAFFDSPNLVFSQLSILFFALVFFSTAFTLLPANLCLAKEVVENITTKHLNGLRFCALCFYLLSWYSTYYLTVLIFYNG
jgi:hypothetical protein